MLALKHQSKSAFAAKFRAKYASAAGAEALRLAEMLVDWIDAGDMTETDVRTAFGFNHGQYTSFVTRIGNRKALMQSVKAATGE